MSLADYIAKNYLTADSPKQTQKKSKKRKRKAGTTPESGLIIAEDDINGWEKKIGSADEDAPTTGIDSSLSLLPPSFLFSHIFIYTPTFCKQELSPYKKKKSPHLHRRLP